MKFQDKYRSVRFPKYSIGRFYRTDIRKIAALQQYYKYLFPDIISFDPVRFLGKLMERDNTLFYAVKKQKLVIGYGFSSIVSDFKVVELYMYKKKRPFTFKEFKGFASVQLEFLIEQLGIRKVYARVPAALKGLIYMAQRFGFSVEGILRQDTLYDKEVQDIVILGMLRGEFK